MNKLNQCSYCNGAAKIKRKVVNFADTIIHKYYVQCTKCGASTKKNDTYFAYYLNGKRFHAMTEKEAINKAAYDWNNGIFDIQTRLEHMSDREKMLWYTEHLLGVAWYGAMVPVESLKWKTAWKIREIAEDKKLLVLQSDINHDLGDVAKKLLNDDQVRDLITSYLREESDS